MSCRKSLQAMRAGPAG